MECISNNFFPWDKTPASVVTTSSLVVAVVSAALIAVSYAMQWGMPATVSLSSLTGLCLLIPLAIVLCKKKCGQRTYDREAVRSNLPSKHFPQAFPNDYVADPNELPHNTILKELYQLLKKGDIDTFQQAIEFITPEDLHSLCFCSGFIIDPDDKTTTLAEEDGKRVGHDLFELILRQKSEEKKREFLRALLTRVDDHSVYVFQEVYLSELLKINIRTLISLCFNKFNKETIKTIVRQALKENNEVWVQAFFIKWVKDKELQDAISDQALCEAVITSPRSVESKKELLTKVISHRGKTLETFDVEGYSGLNYSCSSLHQQMSLLHLAIDAKDEALVKALATSRILLEKPAIAGSKDQFTPLHRAVLVGDSTIVKILVDAGANKKASVRPPPAAPITPYVLAQDKKYNEIADMVKP